MLHVFCGATREAFAKHIFRLDFILLVLTYLIVKSPKLMVELASMCCSPTIDQPVLSSRGRGDDLLT